MAPAVAAVSGRVLWLVSRALVSHAYAMTNPTPSDREGDEVALSDEEPASEDETRAHLLVRAKRPFAPIYKGFVQNPDKKAASRGGPLAQFIRNGDLRGLRAFLFLHAIINSGGDNGWSTTLPLAVWARVFDTTKAADRRSSSTAATKVITRLAARKLVTRERNGRALCGRGHPAAARRLGGAVHQARRHVRPVPQAEQPILDRRLVRAARSAGHRRLSWSRSTRSRGSSCRPRGCRSDGLLRRHR